jgi:putative endonuclease
MSEGGFVYIMTNRPEGTLYIGVSNSLARRMSEHRAGTGASFVRRYNLHRLVYVERHEDIARAIEREKQI